MQKIDEAVDRVIAAIGKSRDTFTKKDLDTAIQAIRPGTPNKAAVERRLRAVAA